MKIEDHAQPLLERGEVHWDALSGARLRLPHSLVIMMIMTMMVMMMIIMEMGWK